MGRELDHLDRGRCLIPTIPCLHFQGTCAEALASRAEVFGGTGLTTMRCADGPDASAARAGSDRIMHGQVTPGRHRFDGLCAALLRKACGIPLVG